MKAKVYVFLANGFETVEALAVVDVLRRGGVAVETVSVGTEKEVESSHGVRVTVDRLFEAASFEDVQMLLLPGGMPGATNLNAHQGLRNALVAHAEKGGMLGAICAAPLVLGGLGLLKGRRATCYPGFEHELEGAHYTADRVTVDGNIVTGKGPAATLPYAYTLLEMLEGAEKAQQVKAAMLYAD